VRLFMEGWPTIWFKVNRLPLHRLSLCPTNTNWFSALVPTNTPLFQNHFHIQNTTHIRLLRHGMLPHSLHINNTLSIIPPSTRCPILLLRLMPSPSRSHPTTFQQASIPLQLQVLPQRPLLKLQLVRLRLLPLL